MINESYLRFIKWNSLHTFRPSVDPTQVLCRWSSRPPPNSPCWASCAFDEISLATNIKDKLNRNQVVTSLKRIQVFLKTLRSIPETGIAIYAGNDELYTISPPLPIPTFLYRCDRRFYTDVLIPLYEVKETVCVTMANGDGYLVYLVKGTRIECIRKKSIKLQKRQSKGGQSALRFSRIAEEKRGWYVTEICEAIASIKQQRNYILGSVEMVRDICTSLPYLIRLPLTLFDETTVLALVGEGKLDAEPTDVGHYISDVSIHPDMYMFGKEVIEAIGNHQVQLVITDKSHKPMIDDAGKYSVIVSEQATQYGGIIGKRWYAVTD